MGQLRNYSQDDSANVRFASDAGGTLTTFTLQSIGATSVPYNLVFDPTAPNSSAVQRTSASAIFNSAYLPTILPIDGSSTDGNVLEGDLRIYIAPETYPITGTYTSTIYCILTQP